MFGGDNELGNILQEAVKLKSAQMGQKRKTYETWPFFVQHTLFHGEKDNFKAWRQLPFPEKMKHCEAIKEEGNRLYAAGSWSDAVDRYEEAPTLVYYCYSTDPGWRKNNRGIDDDVLVLVDDTGSSEEDASQQRKLRLSCALNIAACKQKLAKYDEVMVACDTALELDPQNVKALYRRAEARTKPTKSTAYDHDMAIKDLAKAFQADPKNQAVEKLLTKLRGERKIQRGKDQKTFTGLFTRGQIYDKREGADAPLPGSDEAEMQAIRSRIDSITDEDSLEKRTADAELLRDLYMRNGKEEEARDLNDKIQAAKQALRERERPALDWDNPTADMLEDAKKYDLDLSDPVVIQELKRIEREGLGNMPLDGDSGEPLPSSGSGASPFFDDDETLPLPEGEDEPVPWMRYVCLYAVVFAAWRLIDAGFFGWLCVWIWQRVLLRLASILGLGRSEDGDTDEKGGSLFAFAYRKIASALGNDLDEVEL
mmetsp:Transcript_35064/g.98461  ORF Transcript_35064/g.98461 Transcript_35064/m.98461 type:complete len:482 (+) Transcript_35064:140-1585(+)